jgi:hypothetical protein
VFLLFGAALQAQDLVEEVAVGEIAFRGLLEEGRELSLDPVEPEPLAELGQPLELGRGQGAAPASASAAYTPRSRTATSLPAGSSGSQRGGAGGAASPGGRSRPA